MVWNEALLWLSVHILHKMVPSFMALFPSRLLFCPGSARNPLDPQPSGFHLMLLCDNQQGLWVLKVPKEGNLATRDGSKTCN